MVRKKHGSSRFVRQPDERKDRSSLRFFIKPLQHWVFPGFSHPAELFHPISNYAGTFFLLHSRTKLAVFFNPANWIRITPLQTEGAGGHVGRRAETSFTVWARDPQTRKNAKFVMKINEPEKMCRVPQEVEAALDIQKAGVRTERPVGYWVSPKNIRYSIFLCESGKTLHYRKKEDPRLVLAAARDYGRLFKAGILHKDTGTKHVMVHQEKTRLFDFEFVEKSRDPIRLQKEFVHFLESALWDGSIQTPEILHDTLNEYLKEIYRKPSAAERQHLLALADEAISKSVEAIQGQLLETRSSQERKQLTQKLEAFMLSLHLVKTTK